MLRILLLTIADHGRPLGDNQDFFSSISLARR
jgi:hypothetical protein